MLKLWKAGPLQKWLMNFLPTTASPTYTCTTRELDVTPAVLIALSSKNVSRLLRAKSGNGASGKRCDIDLSCRPRRGSAEPNQAAIGRRSEGRVSGQRTSQSLIITIKMNSERCLGSARHDKKAICLSSALGPRFRDSRYAPFNRENAKLKRVGKNSWRSGYQPDSASSLPDC